jgi:hypothetical protein
MKSLLFAILLCLLNLDSQAQTVPVFDISQETVDRKAYQSYVDSVEKQRGGFYEDEHYSVKKQCHGEFGGFVTFKNKKTGLQYVCGATCAVSLVKMGKKYVLTNTLAHMVGFSNIVAISNPDSLQRLARPTPKGRKLEQFEYHQKNTTAKVGLKSLVDTLGVLTMLSFVFQEQLFHLVTDFKNTYVTTITKGRFVTVATIPGISPWCYDPAPIRLSNKGWLLSFENNDAEGFVEVVGNKIRVIRYK